MKIRLHWRKGLASAISRTVPSLRITRGPEIPENSVPHCWIQSFQNEARGPLPTPLCPAEGWGGSHWCLEHVAPGFPPSRSGGATVDLREESLRAALLWWGGFLRVSPIFCLNSLKAALAVELFCKNLWWVLQWYLIQTDFIHFPLLYSSVLCSNAIAEHFVFCLNQYDFHCIEKLSSSALIIFCFNSATRNYS